MTTKPPSGLAASGPADDLDPEQVTKEHSEDGQDINVDPSEDVTVEATEDVTTEAASETPTPEFRPGTVGVSPGQRAPTLLGVPIASLPLPGVTSASANEDATRTIDYNEEVTVLAQPSSTDPLAVLDALDRPSITDDDEEETKVEPAETAMKAAETMDDVTTALSAQASLEREKALRRSVPPPSMSDDLEFADPEAEDEDENIDDELDDDDEVISAGGAIEEEEDDVGEEVGDGAPTATFMKSSDSTGLSGLLNPRRPPTGGRDGFGSRLPTPYPPPQSPIPGPSTSPFASRVGPAPTGSPYSSRPTGSPMPAIQVPPPSGKATTETSPSFFQKQVPMSGVILLCFGFLTVGFGIRGIGGKSAPAPAVIVTKPAAPAPAPAVVVVPVQGGQPAANPEVTPEPGANKPAALTGTEAQAGNPPPGENPDNPEAGMWRPAKKPPVAAQRPRKPAAPVDTMAEDGDTSAKPKPAIAKEPKPAPTPKPAVVKEPKPTTTASAKPAKKPAKAWVDPFAN